MDSTLATILLGALGAMSLQSRAMARSGGPGGRGRGMDRYQRRALSAFVLVMLAALALAWWAQEGPRPLADAGLRGQTLFDLLVFAGLALAFAGLRGLAAPAAAARAALGLGLACVGVMVFGFRLVFAAEGSAAHALLLDLCAAWGLTPAGVGLLALAHYLLAPLCLAMAFVAGDGQRPVDDDRRDQPYQGVFHVALVLALLSVATAWRVVVG